MSEPLSEPLESKRRGGRPGPRRAQYKVCLDAHHVEALKATGKPLAQAVRDALDFAFALRVSPLAQAVHGELRRSVEDGAP